MFDLLLFHYKFNQGNFIMNNFSLLILYNHLDVKIKLNILFLTNSII